MALRAALAPVQLVALGAVLALDRGGREPVALGAGPSARPRRSASRWPSEALAPVELVALRTALALDRGGRELVALEAVEKLSQPRVEPDVERAEPG